MIPVTCERGSASPVKDPDFCQANATHDWRGTTAVVWLSFQAVDLCFVGMRNEGYAVPKISEFLAVYMMVPWLWLQPFYL